MGEERHAVATDEAFKDRPFSCPRCQLMGTFFTRSDSGIMEEIKVYTCGRCKFRQLFAVKEFEASRMGEFLRYHDCGADEVAEVIEQYGIFNDANLELHRSKKTEKKN